MLENISVILLFLLNTRLNTLLLCISLLISILSVIIMCDFVSIVLSVSVLACF